MIDKKHCLGCRDDFYNGKNSMGIMECWSLRDAEFGDRKIIPVWQRPPYDSIPVERIPTCYRRDGCVTVHPEKDLTPAGYWR